MAIYPPNQPDQYFFGQHEDNDDNSTIEISMKACRYKELIHKSSFLSLQNQQLIREVENMKFEANRMLPSPTNRNSKLLKPIDENTPLDKLSDESSPNGNRTTLIDLLDELEIKLDNSRTRLKDFSNLQSIPTSTFDSIASQQFLENHQFHPQQSQLISSQPFHHPSFDLNLSNHSIIVPPITHQFTPLSNSSQFFDTTTGRGSFIPPLQTNILSSSSIIQQQPFDILTRSTLMMFDQHANPSSWVPRLPPPTLYGNILLWHLCRLGEVFRGLQLSILSTALQRIRFHKLNKTNRSTATAIVKLDELFNGDGLLGNRINKINRSERLQIHSDNDGPLNIYLVDHNNNTFDSHSTQLLRSVFRLFISFKINVTEQVMMAFVENNKLITFARNIQFPAGAQIIGNMINSVKQRKLRFALRELYRKSRGSRIKATLGMVKWRGLEESGIGYSNEYDEDYSSHENDDDGAADTFLSESSPRVVIINDGYISPSPRIDDDDETSIDSSDFDSPDDFGNEGGLKQLVYSRDPLQASRKGHVDNNYSWNYYHDEEV